MSGDQIGTVDQKNTTAGDIERHNVLTRFGAYRRPTEVTAPKFKQIQEKAQELALLIYDLCPYSQQRATALTQLEMCKMSANASIAIHQGDIPA